MKLNRLMMGAALAFGLTGAAFAQTSALSPTPPMGWNDWAHYECRYTADTILANARALVSTGLAARGYDRVTIDDCWMAKHRNAKGELAPNLKRFPHGIAPVAKAVQAMGLKFGIYEDSGSETCGGFAGSGEAPSGGHAHFKQDMRQFASWGVDYVKLDGCNVRVPEGVSQNDAYRKAYADASAAIKASGTKMIFLESAPAYFQGTPAWYDVLGWVGQYGQLWREGSDIAVYNPKHPSRSRFHSVEWNYVYNRPLGRYQKPGNWNDPDFIIGGDAGMSLAQTRSQVALWAMMSAPLVLSVDVAKLSPASIKVIGNKAVIAVDQDKLGATASLVRRTPSSDVLLKWLADGDYALAVFNHGKQPVNVDLPLTDLGFASAAACHLGLRNLWTGARQTDVHALKAQVLPDDTVIWRVRPSAACGDATHTGAIVMTVPGSWKDPAARKIDNYARCLSAKGAVERCRGDASERWTASATGQLHANGKCLAEADGQPTLASCAGSAAQHWIYRRNGNLVNAADHRCLGVVATKAGPMRWQMQTCGHNVATQIWSLPG
ncbi:MAG TPA: ricin-type beta-trefoil lectin domain protein [Rhodanobacteraceae bacterium]